MGGIKIRIAKDVLKNWYRSNKLHGITGGLGEGASKTCSSILRQCLGTQQNTLVIIQLEKNSYTEISKVKLVC